MPGPLSPRYVDAQTEFLQKRKKTGSTTETMLYFMALWEWYRCCHAACSALTEYARMFHYFVNLDNCWDYMRSLDHVNEWGKDACCEKEMDGKWRLSGRWNQRSIAEYNVELFQCITFHSIFLSTIIIKPKNLHPALLIQLFLSSAGFNSPQSYCTIIHCLLFPAFNKTLPRAIAPPSVLADGLCGI